MISNLTGPQKNQQNSTLKGKCLLNVNKKSLIRPLRSTWVAALGSFFVVLVFLAAVTRTESVSFAQDPPELQGLENLQGLEEPQDPQLNAQGSILEKTGDGRIRFSFDQQQWQTVIEFFAEEMGFALQPIVQPPTGTFTYFDNETYTPVEAMDILNHALLNQPVPYTLIRNKNMLILQQGGQINPKLIQTVTTKELYERGLYEMLRCYFDMSDLEDMGVAEQVRQLVTPGQAINIIPSANLMIVADTGDVLRTIDKLLKGSREQALKNRLLPRTYKMQHVDPETLLITVRDMMVFDGDSNSARDGSIVISVQTFGDKLFVKATEKRWKEFLEIAEMVDVAADETAGFNYEKPTVRTYEVLTAPLLAFQILNTNLEGRDVKMDQDEETGTIYLMGRREDHDLADSILNELKKGGPNYAIIQVENADAEEILAKLQLFFRQTSEETATSGPVLFADAIANQISVRGKPSEVETVRRMVADMDSSELLDDGPRTTTRFIDADPEDAFGLLEGITDMFEAEGRKNRLNIVMPKDRMQFRSRNKIRMPARSRENLVPDFQQEPLNPPKQSPPVQDFSDRDSGGGAWLEPADSNYVFVSCPAPIQDQDDVGQSSQEVQEPKSDNYRPPEEPESVPGAPIDVKLTRDGIRLDSGDLDALDDLEQLIRNRLKQTSKAAGPTIFPLLYRRVENVKPFLDRLYGLETGGGGGASGLGGALGGILGNAVGGGAGDLIGGMFGGGGGSTASGGLELEGDVVIETDVAFNALLINNATENDLDSILDILEWLDQPEAPQEIDTVGENFYIPIIYRDPVEVKEIVENNLAKYIQSSGSNNPAAAQQNQAAQQARAMQEMMKAVRGGQGRQGGSTQEEEAPKATLAVDERNKALVLTGPRYIYDKVVNLVGKIDTPEPPQTSRLFPLHGRMTPDKVIDALRPMLGDKLIIGDGSGETNGNQNGGRSSARPGGMPTGAAIAPAAGNDAARQQFLRAIQSGAFGRGGAAGGNRGGGTRGGGGGTRGGGLGDRGGRGGR